MKRRGKVSTIVDVARHAGVSNMTVSRVINGGQAVSADLRERVARAVAELNYSPSPAARALVGGETVRICLLHVDSSALYLSELLMGVVDETRRSHVQLTVERYDHAMRDTRLLERLVDDGIGGVVLPPPLGNAPDLLAMLRMSGIASVAVTTGAPEWSLSVGIDDARAAGEMTHYLLSLGHRRIGFITGNPNQAASGERLRGHLGALAAAGLDPDPELIADGLFTYRSGLDAAERLLALDRPPSAIFASNDEMAAAVVATAYRHALKVPDDITVCGFDDTALATTIWPELTTIRQPIAEMARLAVRMLVADIRGPGPASDGTEPRHVSVPYALVKRQSHAAPASRFTASIHQAE